MKKRLLHLALLGAPVGLSVSIFAVILVSLNLQFGRLLSVSGKFVILCGNELNAFIFQTVCAMICGSIWSCASIIWQNDHWSLTKKTIIHFIICAIASFPIVYSMYWISHTIEMIILYFGCFIFVYLLVWTIEYVNLKKNKEGINKTISKK